MLSSTVNWKTVIIDNFVKLYHNSLVFLTMVINAHVINGSDPGAVPGGSTKKFYGAEIGSTDV